MEIIILDTMAVADRNTVLGNDRALIKIFGNIVARSANEFDPALIGLVIGPCALESGQDNCDAHLIQRCR